GVAAEVLDERRPAHQPRQRGGDLRLRDVALDVYVEQVTPRLVTPGTRLEFGHVYSVLRKYLQARDQLSRSVMRGEKQARLVVTAGLLRPLLVTKHEEPREVEVEVLDPLGDYVQAVGLGRPTAGDRPVARLGAHALRQQLGRARRVVLRHGLHAVLPDEALALLERLRVAVDALHVRERGARSDEQVVMHADDALRYHGEHRVGEQVVRLVDGARQAVLDRQAGEVALPPDGGLEGLLERRVPDGLRVRREGVCRLLAERARDALERDTGNGCHGHAGESTPAPRSRRGGWRDARRPRPGSRPA